MSLRIDIHQLGGLAATHELLRRGHGQTRLRLAVARGEVIRVRKGWYALPELPEPYARAARVGGRLTCVSAAVVNGLWVPAHSPALHVAVPPNACQLRTPGNYRKRLGASEPVVVHWDDRPETRLQVDPVTIIAEVCRCQHPAFAFVVCESALHLAFITSSEWRGILGTLPATKASALAEVEGDSESGTESMFRFGMLAEGIPFRQQVRIGADRVDFLLGDRLVIEIDSLAHHDPKKDRERDARLSILGYRVLRFLYHQVVDDWPTVVASVRAALARGDHLA